ncbi:Phenylacetate 2-hydroxylase [Pseudocercospora fuligena]|uniref:Phenylacetate 2-hydroxylase n=1 Tax=Pseudocercospora fuligena TaxID=685502 RepID=A0A8H6RQB6_9PEZI|nr:Phenylacetate 2-hydroxylase [Pseudocercospora fuligena]
MADISPWSIPGSSLHFSVLAAFLLIATGCIYLKYFYTDFASIDGIPEPRGASLFYGHLPLLGKDHATTAEHWARENSWPVLQVRLGCKRVVLLNGFQAARDWLVTNQASTIDRPLFYTFHKVVSKTSAATIGTNPWNERTRKQRLVVGSLTTAPAIKRLAGLIDLETSQMVHSISQQSKNGTNEVCCHLDQKRLALNIILMFCYGKRFESIHDPLLNQILSDAATISTFRSTNVNSQDYVPHLRYLPSFLKDRKRMALANEVRARRDKWLADLLQEVKDQSAAGKSSDCVAAWLLTDDAGRLTSDDVKTILGGLVSGGFDTIATTAIAGIMYLASQDGQAVQQKAYDDILQSYGSAQEAFREAVNNEASQYIVAFAREVLRFYPPLHLLPPRQTIKEFTDSNGVRVPKGVMILPNCQAINRDPATYGPGAHIFRPERWLDKDLPSAVPPPYQFAFGAGSRMCTAVNFSNRILYAIFLRLIVSFKIRHGKDGSPCTDYVEYNRDTTAATACAKDFNAVFEVRDQKAFEDCMRTSAESTKNVTNGIMRK